MVVEADAGYLAVWVMVAVGAVVLDVLGFVLVGVSIEVPGEETLGGRLDDANASAYSNAFSLNIHLILLEEGVAAHSSPFAFWYVAKHVVDICSSISFVCYQGDDGFEG